MRNTVRLIFALLFITSTASAQWRWSPYSWQYSGTKDDSLHVLPKILSNPSLLESGAIRWNPSTSMLQVYDGTTWVDITNASQLSNYYTKTQADTLYMKRMMGRTYPYDSAFYIPPSNPGSSWTLENMGGTANAFSSAPKSILANEYTISMTNNIQYDTTAGGRWKVWNPSYPASYVESGWECISLHCVPSGVSIVNTYPHETFQARAGIDGDSLMNLLETWNQYKSPLVARYDTVFNTGATSYGWYGQDRRPFQWMFAEKAMTNGNVFANLDMYTSQAVSGAKVQFQRSRGKYAAQTALQTNDTIGNIMFNGSDGTKLVNLGRIYAKADANGSANNVPSSVTINASNGNATTGTLSVTSGGNVGINNTAPSSVLHLVKEGFGGTVYLDRYTAGLGVLPPSVYGIASRGTQVSPSAILQNDPLISLNGSGYDGSTLDRNSRGAVQIVADGNWSPTNKPTMLSVYLTNVVDDSRKVFSIDHNGHVGIGDTTDATAMLLVQGAIKATAPSYTSGGYDVLIRNQASGLYESVSNTTFAPASLSTNYVNNNPSGVQSGFFRLNATSDIVSSSPVSFRIGQQGGTSTNTANITIDGVNGDFAGLDYLNINQAQTGNAVIRNNHSSASLTLGAGGSSSNNIVLSTGNVTTFNGNVGLGITPSAKLHVSGTTRLDLGSDATGDMYYRNSSGNVTRLAAGANGTVLTMSSGLPAWQASAGVQSYTGPTGDYTATLTDNVIYVNDNAAPAPVLTLTTASGNSGKTYKIIAYGAGGAQNVTLSSASAITSKTGAAITSVVAGTVLELISDGAGWRQIN